MVSALTVKLFREIKHLRGQFVAIILVIGCGIGTYVMSRSMHASLRLTQQAYYEQGRYADVFVGVHRAPQALLPAISAIDGVAVAEARTVTSVQVDVPGLAEPASATLVSMPTARPMLLNDVHLVSGRRVAEGAFDEVLLYAPFAEANLLTVGDSVSVVLNGKWRRCVVVGTAISPEFVIVMNPGTLMLDSKRVGVMWMSEESVQAAFDMRGAWNSVVVRTYPGASNTAIIAAIDAITKRYGGLGATERDEQMSHRFLTDEIAQLEVTAIVIPMIFLGVAIFLLNIALSRLVATQKATIAILKAFGYANSAIAMHYIGFAVVAVAGGTVLGTIVGYALGMQLSALYMEFYRFPVLVFHVPMDVIVVSAAMSMLAAITGALAAVRSAVRLPPADAMRPASPRVFKPGLLERTGLLGRASPTIMMMLRNIERRALRSVVAIGMIALATAILVLGRFMFDVMDRMIAISFDRAQHEDVTITCSKPVSGSAYYALHDMPGVERVEPFRMVGVDVLGRHAAHTTTLTSVAHDQVLHRVTDTDGRYVTIPSEGLVLTEFVATKLALVVGDTVRLVLRERSRDTVYIPLVATVRELIGAQAYMAPTALARLLDEQRTISGAYVAVDERQLPAFLGQAKRTPTIAGTLVRNVALQSFRDVYVQNIWMSTTYIVVLSVVIAFGVVYNSARIALAERATELASLRILGMSTAEISVILLGEQVVLTMMGIPVGIGLGAALCRWIVGAFEMEYLRLVYVFTASNAGISMLTIAAVTLVTGIVMHRRLVRLDLIAVLKERE